MAYYPGWVADAFPPERIDFSRFDWIDFAFAEPDENFTLGRDESNILSRLVNVAHQNSKKVKLSVGGWDGSKYFSWAVQNDNSRHTFVGNIVDVYSEHNLDGIDIDWEYPGTKGHPQNYVDPSDTANLLEFFRLLRAKLPPTARITAAVQTAPFSGANGLPVNDVRAFADLLDWALLMNYDAWRASSYPGPNAPLDNACRNSSQPAANAEAAVNAWTAAGFPSNKLVLGVPSYGYISQSSATGLRQRSENAPPLNVHAVTDEGADSGQVQFRELVRQNVLCEDPAGPGVYVGCGGFTRGWDACSSTPFVRSDKGKQIVTYDDPQSLGLKSAFAKQHGLLGVNLFDVHGDTDRWELVDSLRQGLGL
ncbi:glycoside hydrolase family 18 protein [Lactarius psammicola]|nr:glycoside hydrolase family 18 protein [Lactarius psammicola]